MQSFQIPRRFGFVCVVCLGVVLAALYAVVYAHPFGDGHPRASGGIVPRAMWTPWDEPAPRTFDFSRLRISMSAPSANAWEFVRYWLVKAEGSEVHTVAGDPGGTTKYGITQRSYPTVDIASLTYDQALTIANRDYWDVVDAERFPPCLGIALFDMAFNAGPTTAVKLMQQALGVTADGKVGEKTLTAARAANPAAVMITFGALRVQYYGRLDTAPTFLRGWADRVLRLQSELQNAGYIPAL